MSETVTLFRPVGEMELERIRAAGIRAFPPRLPWQPIFYRVLSEAYAVEIARDWNTKHEASGYAGYVTRFEASSRSSWRATRSEPYERTGTRSTGSRRRTWAS